MSVDADTVRRIAHLARIAVKEDEVEHLKGEINAILAWVEQLSEVNVEGVEPMTSVTPMAMKKRADAVTDGGIADQIVKNAPASEGNFFPGSKGGRVTRHVYRLRVRVLEHDGRAAAGGARAHLARTGSAARLACDAPVSPEPAQPEPMRQADVTDRD